ncbi:hypothetical protein [Pseudomonas rhodesiae]|jgi:hypothetical protein|uniref:hypothetical protein n=1 Tax=Pseudomonas rhodesiae TaxID=76760 RepID=UPI0020A17CBA|nr:hypothetical protein [Pseudomonas rhodesiae]MCP1515651.1 hypothetical protein [Pseudomonas rhodesiae]MDF9772897.1 hypothetical protein [Pseudomonas rhodesiae]
MQQSPPDVKHADLHDAQAAAGQFPSDVTVPSWEALEALVEGDCVKVGLGEHGMGSEAFWVELVAIGPLQMSGVIVNQLKFTASHNLAAGDVIMIQRDNVFAITK